MLAKLDAHLKRLATGEQLLRRNPLFYGSAAQTIASLEQVALAERIEFTQERLQRVLDVARRTRYGLSIGAPSTIEGWPLLQKDPVRADPAAFHASKPWMVARANTGGTTGMPLRLIRSPQSVVVEQACIDRMIAMLGADALTARMAVLRGDNIKPPSDTAPPYWAFTLGGRRLTFSTNHLNDATLQHYCSALAEFRPDVMWVYPSALESLCRLLARAGTKLHVPRVLASSEMLQPEVWRLAKEWLGCEIVDYYGQAERVAFAYAKHAGEYRFLPGYAHVELIPREIDGEMQTFEVVGTSLWNLAMPLVRYCTGDLLRLPRGCSNRELLEIAHGVRPFAGVIGRSHDVLLAPDGVGILTGIDHIQRGVDHLLRLQVVQSALDRVTLRVLPAPKFGDAQIEQLLANARAKIPENVEIRVEVVDALEKTASGKTPFVIRDPSVQSRFDAVRG